MSNIKPLPGFLWCEKIPDTAPRNVPGFGTVNVTDIRSGLYIVDAPDKEESLVELKKSLLIVRRAGESVPWRQRWFRKEREWGTSLEEQGVAEGTVIALRACAGKDAGDLGVQVRYDEIVAIGQSEGKMAMLPAPGWIMVSLEMTRDDKNNGLFLPRPIIQRYRDAWGAWGTVVAVPKGLERETHEEGVAVGSQVLIPWHEQNGATEFVEMDDPEDGRKYRFAPLDDVMAVMA
jgi:hypothetical protein